MKKLLAVLMAAAMGSTLLSATACSSHRHEYPDTWTVVQAATCLRDGLRERTCKYCDNTIQDVIPATGHVTGGYSADASFHWRQCSVCGIFLDMEAHTVGSDGICSVCKYDANATASLRYSLNARKDSYTLLGGTKDQDLIGAVVIPDRYVGLPVTDIAADAFKGQTRITSITLPSQLANIGSGAFSGCSSLTSLDLPASVKNIENEAFSGCTALERITVQSGNGYFNSDGGILLNGERTRYIHVPMAYQGEVVVPTGVTELSSGIFSGRTGITKITLHGGIVRIGAMTFRGCTGLQELVVPQSVTYIGGHALEGCTSLARLVLPYTWQEGDTELTEPSYGTSTAGGSSTSTWSGNSFVGYLFGTLTFYGNQTNIPASLKTLEFTGGTELKYGLLYGCAHLQNVILPDSLTKIAADVFAGCNSLETINIPKGITAIEPSSLSGCSSLRSIAASPENPSYTSEDGVLYNKDKTKIHIVPAALDGEISIPEGVTRIEAGAFRGRRIEGLTLPDSLQYIGDYAFSDCTLLRTVTLSDQSTLISFGDYAFAQCTALLSITIPATVETIGFMAFGNCNALATAYFKKTMGWERTFATDRQESTLAPASLLENPATAAKELVQYATHYWSRQTEEE